ncbi:MAG: class II histone deacetylase [Proteobacteria bacterium]|nr:class II histone deacetylase [Pseudomonadota bacterium]MDA1072940.1 class II histone deacetylase [Pseudomonadota bacterium]
MPRRTGFLFHELYMWHDTGHAALWYPAGLRVQPGEHAENAETKRRLRNLLDVAGMLDTLVDVRPRHATEEEILRVHTRDYVARIKALSEGSGGNAGEGTPFGHGSYEIASLSAGGVIAMLDAVVEGKVDNGYALVRPPGHHAEPDLGRGFCIFGNIGVALHHARHAHGIRRAAVVDWDVHHGNGTEKIFYEDPDVLTISIHQDNWFPNDSGHIHQTGAGAGVGANLNVPLPPGSGHDAYVGTFERVVAPALRRFRPEIIVIASGFDGSIYDPLGRMMVTTTAYRRMTQIMLELADELCGGRLVLSHEGGYSAAYVPYCGLAVMEELSGTKSRIDDVFAPFVDVAGGHQLYAHQNDVIEKAAALAGAVPQG